MNLYLSPDLGLNSAAFAAAWNSLPECRAAGLAQATPQPASKSLESSLNEVAFALATGLATNALWDLIKLAIAAALQRQQRPARETEIELIERPDGTKITIVRVRE
ncbi:MAG: hypothetical protein KIH69_016385 [Anaerolineae bacterium]|nr:hypothetical protein [Anaerolineae bacterium]